MAASGKVGEAKEHIKAAEKALKTSLLKWRSDYDSAADEYSQAAQCYRVARDYRSSKDCHMRASEYYKKNHAYFHAAKALEKAVVVIKDISSPVEICGLAKESANLYRQHGSVDAAVAIIDKAASVIEERCPEQALILYNLGADVAQAENSAHQATEFLSKASRLLVKTQQYDAALDNLRVEIGHHLENGNTAAAGRLCLAIVLVQLARGDCVAAEKAYKEWGNNCEHQEASTIEQLLAAYDDEDREAAEKALANPFIRHMDVEYAKLATLVKLPSGLNPVPKARVRENAAPSYVSDAQRIAEPNVYKDGTKAGGSAPIPIPPSSSGYLC